MAHGTLLWYNKAGFLPGFARKAGEPSFAAWYTFPPEVKKVRAWQNTSMYPHDSLASYPGKPFRVPYDRASLLKKFWPIRVAARKWGCTYRAARLYILRHPDIAVLVRVVSPSADKPRWIITVRAGTPKIPAMEGNPDMMDPEWQRRMARARWRRRREQGS